jgi:hypothetical protein
VARGRARATRRAGSYAALARARRTSKRFGGHRAAAGLIGPTASGVRGRVRRAADALLRRRPPPGVARPRSSPASPGCRSAGARASAGRARPPAVTLLIDGCRLGTSAPSAGTSLPRPQRSCGADSAIAFGSGRSRSLLRVGSDVAFWLRRPLGQTVAPQLVVRRIFDAAERYDELRRWLAEQWRGGDAAWTPSACDLRRARHPGPRGSGEPAR